MADRLLAALTHYALTGAGGVRRLVGQPGHRLRVGDWRVVFELDAARGEMHVLAIAHRRDVYRR